MNLHCSQLARASASALIPVMLVALIIGVSACSSTAPPRSVTTTAAKDSAAILASKDFLSVLPQLLDPRTTTLHVGPDKSAYTRQLLQGLKKLGYGVRRVTTDQGPDFMSFSEKVSNHFGAEKIKGYTVYLGSVGLERDYAAEKTGGRARPVSPLRIIGSLKKVTLNAESGLGIEQKTASLVNRVVYGRDARPTRTATFSPVTKNKIYTSYFERVTATTIRFDNSSSKWRTLQKSKLNSLLKLYNKETDIFRIIVCTQENASNRSVQESLAIERLRRVSRGIQDMGIDAKVIHTGHCAPSAHLTGNGAADKSVTTQDSSSVVVELRR